MQIQRLNDADVSVMVGKICGEYGQTVPKELTLYEQQLVINAFAAGCYNGIKRTEDLYVEALEGAADGTGDGEQAGRDSDSGDSNDESSGTDLQEGDGGRIQSDEATDGAHSNR